MQWLGDFSRDGLRAACYSVPESMSRLRKSSVEKFVVVTTKPRTREIAVAAFVAGGLLGYFVGAPKAVPVTKGAPDVSQMPSAQAAAAMGNWEYDHANWPAAVQHYEKAIAAGNDTADLRTDLGTAHRYLGHGDKALAEYGIAQRRDPFHQNSLFNQAVVYAEIFHDRPRAIATAREYLRRFPQGRGAEGAQKIIDELAGDGGGVEKKLTEFLTAPKPVRTGQ